MSIACNIYKVWCYIHIAHCVWLLLTENEMELVEEADDGEADEDDPDAEKDLEMTLELSGKHLFITQSYIICIKDSKIG